MFPYTYYEGKSRRAQPAKNHVDIIQRLQRPQPLLSPPVLSRSEFSTVETALGKAKGETQVMSALAHVLKPDTRITSRADQLFTNLELPADLKLSQAKPDSYDGAPPAGIHPDVRQELRQYIQPSKKATELLVSNFFLEGKAVNGDDVVLARQALYDGALGARAMHHLRAFGLPDATHPYTGEADTISVT